MSFPGVFTSAVILTMPVFCQSSDPLRGQWNCSVRQTMKIQTGRIVGSSVVDRVIEFKGDNTATISPRDETGNKQHDVSARWSGESKKLTIQPDGEARLTGAVKGDYLTLQSDQLSADRDLLTRSDWTCRKRR